MPAWLSIVFQEYNKTLFPWLSVAKNVRLAVRELPRREAAARVESVLGQVGLADFAERYPWELSGGMQQRVSLCRSLIHEPALLMLDDTGAIALRAGARFRIRSGPPKARPSTG